MKQIKFNRIFQIVYPLLVYYIFYNMFAALLYYAFNDGKQSLFYLTIAGIITLIPIVLIYFKVPKLIPESLDCSKLVKCIAYIFICVAVGLLLNVIITHTNLIASSKGFERAETILSTGEFVTKIACNVVVIPILEEILYRGIVCGQLAIMTNHIFAIVFSAFCFGILHFNIVQFLYAFIVGIVLGIAYTRTKHLWVVIAAHALINFIVILYN